MSTVGSKIFKENQLLAGGTRIEREEWLTLHCEVLQLAGSGYNRQTLRTIGLDGRRHLHICRVGSHGQGQAAICGRISRSVRIG